MKSHRKPSEETATKHARHPYQAESAMKTGGAITEAAFTPALKIPVASARSSCGNHSDIAFVQDGKIAPSKNPSIVRQTPNCAAPVTVACSKDAIDQAAAATARPVFVPT